VDILLAFFLWGAILDCITAKEWREMSTPDIIASIDTAMEVLLKRRVDKDWMDLLLDVAKRILEKAVEKEPEGENYARV
jgi:hypothetical protein